MLIGRIETAIKTSIQRALDHPEEALPYVRRHAQEMDAAVLDAHIQTFVNPFSLELGEQGRQALETLETMARDSGALR